MAATRAIRGQTAVAKLEGWMTHSGPSLRMEIQCIDLDTPTTRFHLILPYDARERRRQNLVPVGCLFVVCTRMSENMEEVWRGEYIQGQSIISVSYRVKEYFTGCRVGTSVTIKPHT